MGVICFILLSGYPPFYDKNQSKMFHQIKHGNYTFHDAFWRNVSTEAKDFIRCMLCVDPLDRWTADQLKQHPWLHVSDIDLAYRDLRGAVAELSIFNARRRFRSAVGAIMVMNRLSRKGAQVSPI
jgi:calcium/calmodulin-dependent protein kinase I